MFHPLLKLMTGNMIVILLLDAVMEISALHCNVTHQVDAFKYSLSQLSKSSECETSWTELNNMVLTRNSSYDPEKVLILTEQFIVLKDCRDALHFTMECSGVAETISCKANCSSFVDQHQEQDQDQNQKDLKDLKKVNTKICITETWCVTKTKFGVIISLTALFVIILCVTARLIWTKCSRNGEWRAYYSSPAEKQIEIISPV
ncbi:uncharacterized protein LOC115042244 [Echeneis naucrates]|uniref:uncharacterized protein LOC115042244 n=1 Tax=Echeneis naucrates TaxID=173247 RepID=UPI0011142A95|nr:uncharacterized protein LOC115042244 [Echeneis naucrates]